MSQKHRVPTPWGYFSISESQKSGTVPGFGTVPESRDSPGTLVLSQRPGVPTPWSLFINLRDPKVWDSSRPLVLSQKLGTVSERWDCPKDPEFQHLGVYFSRYPKALDTPRPLGLSQKPGTLGLSQRPRVPTQWSLFLNLRDTKSWDSPGMLGLTQRPRVPLPWGLFLNLRDPKAWDSPNFKVFDTFWRDQHNKSSNYRLYSFVWGELLSDKILISKWWMKELLVDEKVTAVNICKT